MPGFDQQPLKLRLVASPEGHFRNNLVVRVQDEHVAGGLDAHITASTNKSPATAEVAFFAHAPPYIRHRAPPGSHVEERHLLVAEAPGLDARKADN